MSSSAIVPSVPDNSAAPVVPASNPVVAGTAALASPGPAAAPVAAPVVSAPVAAPAAQPLTEGQQVAAQAAPAYQAANAAYQKAAQLESTPLPDAGGHSRLMAMVAGLAEGVSAFGTAAATGGREGGAKEVLDFQAKQQQMQIQKQQAASESRDQAVKMALSVGDTNMKVGQNIQLMHMMGTEIDKNNLDYASKKLENTNLQTTVATGQADFQKATGMSVADWNGTTPISGTKQQNAIDFQQRKIDNAAATLPGGRDNPSVVAAQTALTAQRSSKTGVSGQAIFGTTAGLDQALQLESAATARQTAQQTAAKDAPFSDATRASINAQMIQREQILNPKASAATSQFQLKAGATPEDFNRADKVLQQTEQAQGTKAQRDQTNAMREQTLALTRGATGLGDVSKIGPAYLASLPPQRAASVKAFGEGRAQVNSRSFATPAGQALLADITAAYPDYDQSKAVTWDKTRNEYMGSGSTAKKAVSYSTSMEHMQDLYDSTTKEGMFNPLSADYQKREAAMGFVANEVGTAIKTGVMSESEGKQITKGLSGAMTPGLNRERVQEVAKLLHDKVDEYQNKFQDAAPSAAVKVPTLMSPKAATAYDYVRSGGKNQSQSNQSNPLQVTDPRGTVHTFLNQADVSTFKAKAGIQ